MAVLGCGSSAQQLLCRAVLTWELPSASFFSTHHPSCKKLSVLRPGCQMLQLPTQPSLETFWVQTTLCLSFPSLQNRV